jgi:mannitol-specific phosphotransferase system IIBC component
MKKLLIKGMALGMLALPVAAFAHSSVNLRQDEGTKKEEMAKKKNEKKEMKKSHKMAKKTMKKSKKMSKKSTKKEEMPKKPS